MTSPMRDHIDLDIQLLAGFVDGTLTPEEEEQAEKLLATSEAAREVVAEAIRLTEDLEPQRTVSSTSVRRAAQWGLPLLAAAAIAALVVVPSLRRDVTSTSPSIPPEVLSSLPDFWRDRPWGISRSFRVTLSPEVTAFRIGTMWTDAVLMWEGGDAEGARSLLVPMAALLEPVSLAEPAQASLVEAADLAASGVSANEGVALLDVARSRLDSILPAPFLATGRWVEAVKLAALSGRTDLLGPRGPLGDAPADLDGALPPLVTTEIEKLRALLARGAVTPEEAPAVLERVVVLQALLGS